MAPVLHVYLLGDFRLLYREEPVTALDTPRLQSLLAYLILHRDAPQSRQRVSFLFWPNSSEKQARTNLRQLLHHLHRTLPDADRFVSSGANAIQWRPEAPFAADLAEFERALAAVKGAEATGDLRSLRTPIERAAELYRGDLLPSCYDEWVAPERERLREEYSATLERLIALLEDERDHPAAIHHAERLLRHDPLSERTYGTLMRLHALNDNRAAALHAYERCAAVLERELGVQPGPGIRDTYDRLMKLELPVEQNAPGSVPDSALSLIGRRKEWEQLRAAWDVAAHRRAQLFLISGEAGIGKTRLAQELLAWVTRQGIAAAHARSYAAEGRLPFGPVAEWLRSKALGTALPRLDAVWLTQIGRLLPELRTQQPHLPPPEPLNDSSQRRTLFEALARAVLAPDQPLLLFTDDLQWCDQETLEWLRFLLRFAPTAPLLVLGTARSEEVQPNHPLISLVRHLGHEGRIGELALRPLDAAETASLAAQVAGRELGVESTARLYGETEGNPLFIVESVRGMLIGGAWPPDRAEKVTARPSLLAPLTSTSPAVYVVIDARLAQLSSSARDLAGVAATIGRAFTLDVLVTASHSNEESIVQGLEELCQRHIVREHDDTSYDFTHDKLREVAYAEMTAARRRLLHRRAAHALEVVHAADLDSVSAQVGAHYERAGLPRLALDYYGRAARLAERIYAHAEVAEYVRRSLALLQHLPNDRERAALERDLQVALGLSLVPLEGYGAGEVHAICGRVRELSDSLGEAAPPTVLRTLALGKLAVGSPADAGELGSELLVRAEMLKDPVIAVEGHYLLGVVRFWQGRFLTAREHLERALSLYDPRQQRTHLTSYAQDPAVICRIRLALCLWYLGYPDQARTERDLALACATKLSHPLTTVYALSYAAWLSIESSDRTAAEEQAEMALRIAREYELNFWPPTEMVLRGWVRAQQGQVREGIAQMRQGISTQENIGQPLHLPYALVLLARAYGLDQEINDGLATLSQAERLIGSTGISFLQSEVQRLRGELLLAQDGSEFEAERCFRRALEIARSQGARSLALRAATQLSRLSGRRGNRDRAPQELQEVYAAFAEGFDTAELREAKNLLELLS